MGMSDWKKEKETANISKEKLTHIDNDIIAMAIIASALIRQGATKSSVPRESAFMLKELKKCYQENPGSD